MPFALENQDNLSLDTFDSNIPVFETLVDSPVPPPKLGFMGSTEIVELIKSKLDGMPVQMQSAARFVIDHPSEVALLSMREQARKAGVPPATMTRLAQRIGFPGYQDLKDTYVEAIRDNVAWFSGRAVIVLIHEVTREVVDVRSGHQLIGAGHGLAGEGETETVGVKLQDARDGNNTTRPGEGGIGGREAGGRDGFVEGQFDGIHRLRYAAARSHDRDARR